MTLIAAGISHRTAPVAQREWLAVAPELMPAALASLRERFGTGVLLSTCNRTEVYVSSHDGEVEPSALLYHLADFHARGRREPLPRFYALEGLDVVTHLFRVASGVDSMVLGEGQILGQVREALRVASAGWALDAPLSRLFHAALETGKRARHETDIARYAVSVSSAAVDLTRSVLGGTLQGRQALLVGAGGAGKLTARALRDAGVADVVVTNRTVSRAVALAAYLGGTTVPFSDLAAAMACADFVITSSASPNFLIGPEQVQAAVARRRGPLTLIDLAVPRDIDPAVAAVPGAHLYDIDDLQQISEANLQRREQAADEVQRIVRDATGQFARWTETRRAAPTISALMQHADTIRRQEMQRTARDLALDDDARDKLDRMTAAIVKKLLHHPITYVRNHDATEEAAQTLRRLFAIDDSAT